MLPLPWQTNNPHNSSTLRIYDYVTLNSQGGFPDVNEDIELEDYSGGFR